MTEAEEKAVEYLKANSLVRLSENNEVVAYGNAHKYYIINLIEKLKKENEELKYENLNLKEERIIDNSSCKPLNNFYDYYDCIPKDKIRKKLNWYEDTCKRLSKSGIELDMYDRYQGAIELGEELLKEE